MTIATGNTMEPFKAIPWAGLRELYKHVDDIIPENLDRWLDWSKGVPGQFGGTFEQQLQSIITSPWLERG